MRVARSLGVGMLLAIGMLLTTAKPAQAYDWRQGYYNNYYGGYQSPYYWSGVRANPYQGYSAYTNQYQYGNNQLFNNWSNNNWYNNSRYRNYNSYYNWSRSYPWSWY